MLSFQKSATIDLVNRSPRFNNRGRAIIGDVAQLIPIPCYFKLPYKLFCRSRMMRCEGEQGLA